MHPLEHKTLEIITRKHLLLPHESTLILGVSGGPDSVGLLHVMAALRRELGIDPVAVYVDHGLRPGEVEGEHRLVAEMAGNLGLRFIPVSVDVRSHARQEKISQEHAARDLRYDALRQIAAGYDSAPVAVAHTADDQAEEILIRLFRGGGRKALSGMRSRNNDIIRPFLFIWKKDISLYLQEKKISSCQDSSNTDMRFLRNRIRHRLLPYLERNFDRGIRRALCKTADTLAEDEILLDELSKRCLAEVVVDGMSRSEDVAQRLVLDRRKLVEAPAALQRRVVEKLLWQIGGKASYTHIVRIIAAAKSGRAGSEYHLSRGLRLGVQKQYLELQFPRGIGSWRGRLYGA